MKKNEALELLNFIGIPTPGMPRAVPSVLRISYSIFKGNSVSHWGNQGPLKLRNMDEPIGLFGKLDAKPRRRQWNHGCLFGNVRRFSKAAPCAAHLRH